MEWHEKRKCIEDEVWKWSVVTRWQRIGSWGEKKRALGWEVTRWQPIGSWGKKMSAGMGGDKMTSELAAEGNERCHHSLGQETRQPRYRPQRWIINYCEWERTPASKWWGRYRAGTTGDTMVWWELFRVCGRWLCTLMSWVRKMAVA